MISAGRVGRSRAGRVKQVEQDVRRRSIRRLPRYKSLKHNVTTFPVQLPQGADGLMAPAGRMC